MYSAAQNVISRTSGDVTRLSTGDSLSNPACVAAAREASSGAHQFALVIGVPFAARMTAMRLRRNGFTLVELLIAVAIIGIVAAIAIPALTSSLQRARQKRTMGEMRTIATAISAYATDYPFMPKVGPGTADVLAPYLVPTYVRHMTSLDGWQRPIYYEAVGMDYTVRSFGANGVEQTSLKFGPTTSFSDNIVVSNGVFVQWPDGMQTN